MKIRFGERITEFIKTKFSLAYIIFIVLSLTIMGIISYTGYKIDFTAIRLWKEAYIGILFLMSIYMLFTLKKYRYLKIITGILLLFSVWVIYSFSQAGFSQIVYQVKLDAFNLLFLIVTITLFLVLETGKELEKLLNTIFKSVFICTIINVVVVIFQSIYSEFFVTEILGLEWGAWSRKYGISVVTTGPNLRSMGLQLNYIVVSELMVISLILLFESKLFKGMKAIIKYSLGAFLIIGIYFTTYKTAYLWLLFYIGVKLFTYITRNVKVSFGRFTFPTTEIPLSSIYLIILTPVMALAQWIITNTFIFYRLIEKLFPGKAYTSVYIRVEQHQEIYSRMMTIPQKLLGLGMGFNGTYTNKVNHATETITLDSSYIYTISNYGSLGIIIYIGGLSILLGLSGLYHNHDKWGIKYLLSYLLAIQLFFNNLSTSIPVSYIVIIFVVAFIGDIKDILKDNSVLGKYINKI